MFTGIIEDVGKVKSIEKTGQTGRITVETSLDISAVRTGDSIAVNGACLTVTGLSAGSFTADVSSETLRVTTLGGLGTGDPVNIEPALTLGKPLGGHLVSGHVDGVGTVTAMEEKGQYIDLEVEVPEELAATLVKKGSVAVDGISLTVASLEGNRFTVAVIPHTVERTTLRSKRRGSEVNVETDIIGKYVERFLRGRSSDEGGRIDEGFLAEHGFFGGKD